MSAAVAKPIEWVAPEQVRELSRSLGESAQLMSRRLGAYERFLSLPIEPDPLYRGYGYFTNVDLSGLDAVGRGSATRLPPLRPRSVQVVHDAVGTHLVVSDDLPSGHVAIHPLYEEKRAPLRAAAEPMASEEEEPADRLSALSDALRNRGYVLEVAEGTKGPVHVQDLTVLTRPREALSVRRVVRAGANTQLLVTEEVYSAHGPAVGQRFYGSSTELQLGDHAKAVYLTLHAPDLEAVSVYQRSATTGPGSRLAWLWAGLGGFRSKARNRTRLVGNGSSVEDLQLFYGSGDQSYDSAVHLTHVGTDTHGQSITRGVFTDRARGMSRGLVRIEHPAVKTLSFISEHAMLLSRGARSDTIPILEILCRDVKATHSTSVHPIDPEQVFYLTSRGISEPDAVRMIGEGFLSYVLDRAPVPALREVIFPAMEARWNREELAWASDGSRALPELQVTGTESSPEWRFDAKLR